MAITKEQIEKAAQGMGIDSMGVVSLRSPHDAREVKAKPAADLIELEGEARALLPSAASVIVLASAYYDDRPGDLSESGDPHGIIGRALWKDNAVGLRRKAESLISYLKENDVRSILAEDLPLRDLAHRAGLGTRGKNSLLQSFDHGSWILLTALVTDADLPPGEGEDCRCGSCQACLRLCPTKAIATPFNVDASRCIDTLLSSVEDIPMGLRDAIGTRLFSCDVCQEVCPRNKFVLPVSSGAKDCFGRWTRSPSLGLLVMMSEEQYHQGSDQMGWGAPDPYLWRRNAIIALGNSGDHLGTRVLVKGLQDPDPRLRGYASWALAKLGEAASVEHIETALLKEQDAFAKEEMRLALLRFSENEDSG